MSYESSDILGGPSLNISRNDVQVGNVFKISSFIALGLLLWLAWLRGHVVFLKWKETRYKKAMRRRHGIPDEDERPFNVAYAAAVRAREREEKGSSAPGGGGKQPRNALAEGQEGLRQRLNDIGAPQPEPIPHWQNVNKPIIPQIAQAYAQLKQQEQNERADLLGIDSSSIPLEINHNQISRPAPSHQLNTQHLSPILKRSFASDKEDEEDNEPSKKSRVEGEELIDGDEDAEWVYSRTHPHQQRGSKRELGMDSSDEGYESHRGDKRRRNVSESGSTPDDDHGMDMDSGEGDEVSELRDIPRGKKRDRAEAGSTFGGDDEEIDVGADGKASRRRRKRKMVSKRKSEAYAAQIRGTKRDRDASSNESDEEDENFKYSKKNSRTKRGKRNQHEEENSDDSVNGSLVSRESYVKGRRIGEEWEVNGVFYKVGLNGQRLRQALVKRARNKFPMPKDSQHPDREANLEVFVETWLTEEEYKSAKERHEFAWQDSPRQFTEQLPSTPGSSQELPTVKGKNLLWSSTTTPAQDSNSPLPKRRPFRESIATTVGLRINAFPEAQASTTSRRVASAYIPLPPSSGGESPTTQKGTFRRTFSKWEKQDLEAAAMARMRAKSQGSQNKLDGSTGLSAPPLASSASAPGPSTTPSNGFKFTKTGEKDKTPVAPSLSFGDAPKQAEQSKPSSLFPMPSTTTTTKSEEEKKATLESNKTAPPPLGLFSSQGPMSAQPSKPAPASTSGSPIPNFFGNKGATAPATATSQPAAENKTLSFDFPPAQAAPQPAPSSSTFSFGAKPATSSVFGSGDQKKEESAKPASGSNSLLSRLGGFTPPVATSGESTQPASSTTATGSLFTFGKTSAPATKPTSIFGSTPSNNSQSAAKPTSVFGTNPTTQPTSVFGMTTFNSNESTAKPTSVFGSSEQTNPTSTFGNTSSVFGGASSAPSQNAPNAIPTPNTISTPKFNFGPPNKPTSSLPSAAPTSGASPGAIAETKPTSSAFGPDANKSTAPSQLPASSSTPASAAPKFKFNIPSGSFGSSSPLGSGGPSTAPKTGFGGFGAGTGSSNAFGTTISTSTKSAFGYGSTNKNTASDKPADAPKSTFAWPSASTSNGTPNSASPFSINKSSSTTNDSNAPSPFSAPTSTTSNGTQPIFGQAGFHFGSNTSSGTANFGGFGQKQEEKK